MVAAKKVPPKQCYNCFCKSKGRLNSKQRRALLRQKKKRRRKSALELLGEQAD